MSAIIYKACRLFLLLIVATVVFAVPSRAQQTGDDIRQLLQGRDLDIKALVGTVDDIPGDVKEQLRSVINDLIDFQSMGEAALGRHWSKLSDQQKSEFVDTFSKIVRSQSLASLDVYRASVTYDEIIVSGSGAHVVTTTMYKDVPTKVEYVLRFNGDTWVATDIILDEVSTVKGYSRSFQSVIRKNGFDELMQKLYARLEESESPVS